jgi:hypothetical protein
VRRGATVLRRVGEQLTLDLGGGDTLIVSDTQRLFSTGDTVVVVLEEGNLRVGRSGQRASIPGVGSFVVQAGDQIPKAVRVRLEQPAASQLEADFGESHRVVPTLMTFAVAQRSLT